MAATNDAPRKYQINAGQCPRCGNYKTWEFKVTNQASGKMMPGHVDANGFKIGNGDCPAFKPSASKKASDDAARALFEAPQASRPTAATTATTTTIMAPGGPGGPTADVATMPKAERVDGGGVLVTIGNTRVELASQEALHLCKEILARLAGE